MSFVKRLLDAGLSFAIDGNHLQVSPRPADPRLRALIEENLDALYEVTATAQKATAALIEQASRPRVDR